MTDQSTIRMLNASDLDVYILHLGRTHLESGRDGDLPHGPYPRDDPFEPKERREKFEKRWSTPVGEPGWGRAWGVLRADGSCVGGATLDGSTLAAMRHRARVGLGVERAHRGNGRGLALMEAVITWARAEPGLDWLDLGVFAGNDVAHRMYQRLGFSETGRTPDLFRVDEWSLEDISMVLPVRDRPIA